LFLRPPRHPLLSLFPYTTLFRSPLAARDERRGAGGVEARVGHQQLGGEHEPLEKERDRHHHAQCPQTPEVGAADEADDEQRRGAGDERGDEELREEERALPEVAALRLPEEEGAIARGRPCEDE